MDHNCQYPDLKSMLKELAGDMKTFVKDQIMLLEANMTKNQIVAIQEAKDKITAIDKKQSMLETTSLDHDARIARIFTILDEIRDSYQQAVGAFKLWGMVCGIATFISTVVAIYMALKK